ncbi:MAG: methyltransferase domain-containing protein [Nocardiopsaceae bacterium]|nr:methyltransferase domain-containing protein [Nocardiopsaceae bacterium]
MTTRSTEASGPPSGGQLGPAGIFDMLLAYKNTAVLSAGIELGVFDALAAGATTSSEVAKRQRLDPRGAKLLLNGLAALGLLQPEDHAYRLSAAAEKFLVRGSPSYIGDMAKVMASKWEWEALGKLPEAVRHGGTVTAENAETPDYPYWQDFAAHAGAVAAPTAELMADVLGPWASRREPLHVLDVACGHGLYGYTLARQQPHARIWSLDWPNVLPLARERAIRMGVGDRITTIAGDMFELDLGGPYDVVMITNVLHHFSERRASELLRRAAGSMTDDGRIALVGFTISDAPPAAEAAAHLFSILMLIWTSEGEVHTESAYERMLVGAGFSDVTLHPVPALPLRVIIARRTAAGSSAELVEPPSGLVVEPGSPAQKP